MSIDTTITTMTTTTVNNNNINCVGCSNNSIPLASSSSSILDGIQLDVLIISSFFYICIFITGVVGNLLVVYVLLKEKELKNFTNYLLANLSIADLMVLFTCVPPAFHDLFANNKWYLGKIMCYSFEFSQYCTGIASILSLFMITCERYYVICKPLAFKSVITKSRTVKLVILIWIISVSINLPLIFFTKYEQISPNNTTNLENNQQSNDIIEISNNHTEEYKCEMFFDEHFNNWHIYYILTIAFFVYFFLGIVLMFMYYKIAQHLKESQDMLNKSGNINNKKKLIYKSNKNANLDNAETNLIMSSENDYENNSTMKFNQKKSKSNNNLKTDTLQSASENSSSTDFEKFIKPRKQLIFMLQCIIIVFYVCVYPFKMLSLINVFYSLPLIFSERTLSYVVMAARILFYMNSSINPILYNMLSKKFRHSFKRLLIFRICFGKQDDCVKNNNASNNTTTTNNNNNNNQSSNFNIGSTTK